MKITTYCLKPLMEKKVTDVDRVICSIDAGGLIQKVFPLPFRQLQICTTQTRSLTDLYPNPHHSCAAAEFISVCILKY